MAVHQLNIFENGCCNNEFKKPTQMNLRNILPPLSILLNFMLFPPFLNAQQSTKIDQKSFSPATFMWYTKAATQWEEALPVGNGRLGAMVYGKTNEEIIQLNEDTYWSGGPYSTVVKGGAKS